MNNWTAIVAAFLGSAVSASLIVRWVRTVGSRRGLLDHPNARSSHEVPTPRGGGVGIVFVVVVAITLLAGRAPALVPIGVGLVCIALTGFVDDLRGLGALPRLFVHVVVAIATVVQYGAMRELALPGLPVTHLGMLGTLLTVAWIVGLTNAYNFMDGIDGIAAGQAVVAALAWMLLFGQQGHIPLALMTGAVAGACAGFLVFNWSPASIFMGDVGSGALGYLFATMPLLMNGTDSGERSLPWFFAAATLVPFVFDTAYTFIARAGRRENVLQAHRSHLYQRLVRRGLSHGRVAGLYVALAIYTSTLALVAVKSAGWFTTVAIAVPFVLLVVLVRAVERNSGVPVRSDA